MFRSIAVCVLVSCLALAGCKDDPARPVNKNTGPAYKNMTEEWHALFNLELAYDNKDADRYAELFDADNFVFFFNPGDVGADGVPESWTFAEEMTCVQNMFGGAGGMDDIPITTIDLTLHDIKGVAWEDAVSAEFPGETLRRGTVDYSFLIHTIYDHTYRSPDTMANARFILREVDGKWKIVWWYDLEGGLASRVAAGTEETSWGRVKALYQ